jgi:hypothetical protein
MPSGFVWFLLVWLMPVQGPAQPATEQEDIIRWSAGRKLQWSDFQGQPDPKSPALAVSATVLGFTPVIKNNRLFFSLSAYFIKTESWSREKNDYLLRHEQGHFDITEIFARKLYKKLNAYHYNKDTFKEEVKKIYHDILREKEHMQQQYDLQTDYSRKKNRQEQWRKKIAKMLEELKEYAHYRQ